MEGTKHIRLILLILLVFPVYGEASVGASRPDIRKAYQDSIYTAYVEDRMPLWEQTLQAMEEAYAILPDDSLLYDILLAQYGLIGYYLGADKKNRGEILLEKAEDYLAIFEEAPEAEVQAKLFRAAFLAFHITLRPWRSVRLGIASERLINQALELDEDYPRGHLEKGNMLFFAPAIFGGSKSRAVGHYERAAALFRDNPANNHRWLYLSTLVSLAIAYQETGNGEAAVTTLEKALVYEPGFGWVQKELLPEMRSRQK